MATRRSLCVLTWLLLLPATTARADRHWWDISAAAAGSKTPRGSQDTVRAAKSAGGSAFAREDYEIGKHFSTSAHVPQFLVKRNGFYLVGDADYQESGSFSRDTFLGGLRYMPPYKEPTCDRKDPVCAQEHERAENESRHRAAWFAHVLAGKVRTTEGGASRWDFAAAVGGGLDAPIA
ncbi:MAG TPA: hypothetical protein VF310_10050, partial [Vicinamibacteria bacterium]